MIREYDDHTIPSALKYNPANSLPPLTFTPKMSVNVLASIVKNAL